MAIDTMFNHIDEFPPVGSCDHEEMERVLNQHATETNKFNPFIDEINQFENKQNIQYSSILNIKHEIEDAENRIQQSETRINKIEQQVYAYSMQNLATLPVGTINNDLIAWNTAWSSAKIKQILDSKTTEPPTVSGTMQVYEGREVILTTAADTDVKIKGTAHLGTIFQKDGKTYYAAPTSISQDGIIDELRVYAIKEGYMRSDDVDMAIILKKLQIILDDMLNVDLTGVTNKNNIVVDGTSIKGIADVATCETITYSYSYSLKKYQMNYVCHPKDIAVNPDSTNVTLKTTSTVPDGTYIVVTDGSATSRVIVSGTSGQAPIANNPDPFGDGYGTSLWHFDGNANDVAGNFNGNLTASNASYVAGKFGQAIQFNDQWDVGLDVGGVNNRNTDRTITFWAKDCSEGHLWHSKEEKIYVYASGGKVRVTAKDQADNFLYEYTDVTVDDGNWHFFALIINAANTTAKLIVDGAYVKTLTIDGGAANSDYPFTGFGDGLTGKIDEARYFSRELTQQEIQQIMENQASSFEIDITGAGLTNAVTKAFHDIPSISVVTDDEEINENTFDSISVVGGDVSVSLPEHPIDSKTIKVKIGLNKDDYLGSITIQKWRENT